MNSDVRTLPTTRSCNGTIAVVARSGLRLPLTRSSLSAKIRSSASAAASVASLANLPITGRKRKLPPSGAITIGTQITVCCGNSNPSGITPTIVFR